VSLRDVAEADSKAILEDSVTGFGYPITVTSPDKVTASLTGFSNDISGRTASVALSIRSLTEAGYTTLPKGIQDEKSKPWLVQFNGINGNPFTFKVTEGHPDRGLGIMTCTLEIYRDQTKCQ
jgi:hypothetical protein